MSWWDSANFGNLASQALKSAQKRIDKVLDIPEEERQALGKETFLKCHCHSNEAPSQINTPFCFTECITFDSTGCF